MRRKEVEDFSSVLRTILRVILLAAIVAGISSVNASSNHDTSRNLCVAHISSISSSKSTIDGQAAAAEVEVVSAGGFDVYSRMDR